MPTAPAARISAPSARPRSAAPAAQSSAVGTVTIDPIRLLKKYRWVLSGAVVAGAMLGTVAHFGFLFFYPIYESSTIFKIEGPKTDATQATENVDSDELERFMKTQSVAMVSQRVLLGFLQRTDPSVMHAEAGTWTSRFSDPSGGFNTVEAFEDLEKITNANVIPETQYIMLNVRTHDAGDAAFLCGKIREFYLADLGVQERISTGKRLESIIKQIENLEKEVETLQTEREEIIRVKGIQSAEERANAKFQEIALVNAAMSEILVQRDAAIQMLTRFEQMMEAPGGVQYPDDILVSIEALPTLQYLIQTINQVEAQIRTLTLEVGEQHMMLKQMRSTLAGQKAQLETQREAELPKYFSAQVEQIRSALGAFDRQISELDVRKEKLGKELNELTTILRDIHDMNESIENKLDRKNDLEGERANLEALQEIAMTTDESKRRLYISRVSVVQGESVADVPVFPKLKLMIPVGVFLFGGLVGGIVVLREILDQRVKGASDISLIPRTRVVGVVTQGDSDPSKPKAIETAFRDQPTGVIAEQFRQVRTHLQKRMQQSGHRSLLIASGMPESGATTCAINLAMAFSASDQRVLLIDANLRRPAIHTTLGCSEQPGLCDILAGDLTLSDAAQKTDRDNLDVLSVGTRKHRVAEFLASETMGKLLAEAGAGYDLVIIDTSPAIVSGDAMALANRCDATILVVRAMCEKRGMVARIRNEFDESRGEFLGVLVNGVRHAAGGYLKQNIRVTHAYQNTGE